MNQLETEQGWIIPIHPCINLTLTTLPISPEKKIRSNHLVLRLNEIQADLSFEPEPASKIMRFFDIHSWSRQVSPERETLLLQEMGAIISQLGDC